MSIGAKIRANGKLTKRFRSIVRGVLAAASELLQARAGPYRGTFDTRAQAESAATTAASRRRRVVGYDNPETAEIYIDEVTTTRSSDYAILYWLVKKLRPGFRVFDWGGNLGHSYYTYREYLDYPADLSWTICDVPEIVQAGTRLAERWNAANLRFTTESDECDGCDVLLISGALQYIPQSIDDLLGGLCHKPTTIFINRTPVHANRGYFTLQDIGPAICAYQVFAERELLDTLSMQGYALRASWPCEGKSIRIPFRPSATIERYTGFLFELRAST